MIRLFSWLLIIFVSSTVALYGWGFQYPDLITPRASYNLLDKIHGDRWMEQSASLTLPGLGQRGNILNIKFNDWHPANQPPPEIKVFVCQQKVAEFLLMNQPLIPVSLDGECEPRLVEFEFANVFKASATDTRDVTVQLYSFNITSRLGVPVVAMSTLLATVLALIVSLLLLHSLVRGYTFVLLTILLLSLAYYLVAGAGFQNYEKLLAAWSGFTSLLLGASLYNKFEFQAVRDNSSLLTKLSLLLIFVLGVGLRLTGIDFGLPYIYHPDEYQKYLAVMRMVSFGDLNPRYFLHPSMLLYSTYGMNVIVQAFSDWPSWDASLILSGRIVSCLAGSISIVLLYYIGSRLFSRYVGLLAAAFLAVFPLHVTCSRYLKEDALLTFFVLCTVSLVVSAATNDRPKRLILAGIFAGLTASVKYSGLLAVFAIWGYPWLVTRRLLPKFENILPAVLASSVIPFGFLLGTPYSLLDYPKFLMDFNSERQHMISGHSSAITAASQYWTFHLRNSLPEGIGLVALLLALIASGYILRRFRFPSLYVLGLIALFYLPAEYVRAKPAPQPERYVLPCLPFIALAIGYLSVLITKNRVLKVVITMATFFALITAGVRSVELASEVSFDTRDKMAQWISENLPSDARVHIDWQQYGPQFLVAPVKVSYSHPTEVLLDLHPEALKEKGYDYLVISSLHYDRYFTQPNIVPAYREVIRKLFRNYSIVHEESSKYGSYGFHNPRLVLFQLK